MPAQNRFQKFDAHGQPIDDDEDERVLRDGQRIRVPVMLMDHATGFFMPAEMLDARTEARRDQFKARLSNAWRDADVPPAPKAPALSDSAKSNPYAVAEHHLNNAWRTPPAAIWDR